MPYSTLYVCPLSAFVNTVFLLILLAFILSLARSCKRSETLFKSLLFWLAGEVSWLAVEVLSPCRK